MLKRIIFDLDNTLIPWEDEENWKKVNKELIKKYKINQQECKKVKKILNTYEKVEEIFNMENMQKMINAELKKEYQLDFLQTIKNVFEQCIPTELNKELEETLKYLSSKYELVVLTNWYEEQQVNRLKNYGILKYFKNVYGADKFKVKPNKEAYEVAIGGNSKEECIMIGDGIENDVQGAIDNEIDAILYAPTQVNNIAISKKYKIITDLSELRQIF